MRTKILIVLLFSFYFSFSQDDNPIVDKIKNIKELYEMDLITKKEYDSITKILVNDLVNQKSSSNVKLDSPKPNKDNTEYIINSYGWYDVWKTDENGIRIKISTVKNPGDELNNNPSDNQMNSQESLVFEDDTGLLGIDNSTWAIALGFGQGEATVDGYSGSVKSTGWSLGLINRWYSSESTAWEVGFAYGQSKPEDFDETSSAVGLDVSTLLYVDPSSGGFHFTIGIGYEMSLEEEIEGIKQGLGVFGLGVGMDISDEFTISAAWSAPFTEPYEGYLSDLNDEVEISSFGISLKLRL